ncbi:MAG: hypothetical protein ACQEQF_05890 [Bacillota bacterium]
MPIPFIIGGLAAGLGAAGAKKSYDAAKDIKKAKGINDKAQRKSKIAKRKLNKGRKKTKNALKELGKEKLSILSNNMNEFVLTFEKIKEVDFKESIGINELQNLNLSKEELKELRTISLKAVELLEGGTTSLGTGALVAYGSYGAVMTLGTASTGTAIGTLSGAAATNATLAWLGGGSLAAGGYGMAGGMAVLGGVVAGPALAVGGFIMSSKAKQKLNDANNNLDKAKTFLQQSKIACKALSGIEKRTKQIKNVLQKLDNHFSKGINKMEYIIEEQGVNWNNYTEYAKQVIYINAQLAQTIKIIVDTPLLDEDGEITKKSKEALLTGKKHIDKINKI